jgi:hypothetical protein
VIGIINRKTLGSISLAIATFLNPFGFDILVYKLTELTKSYWHTMLVLYCFAGLFFGFSYIFFRFGKKVFGNIMLAVAMFLNPLGFDIVVYGITCLTHDYWMTMSIMYALAGTFFVLFMYLYNINPIEAFSYHAKRTHNNIKLKLKKK